jgi:curved DNA-binding protein CbpA
MPTYYQILGVSATADKEEIKVAFKKLALRLHPDKNPGNPLAEEQFKQVNEAYQVLSNDQRRATYDFKLQYAAQAPLPHYPEDDTEDDRRYRGRYHQAARQPSYSYGRPRYAPHVEFDPAQVRRMGIMLGIFFVFFVIGVIYLAQFMNRLNAEDRYEAALQEGKTYSAMLGFSEAIGYDKEYWQAYYQRGLLRMEVQNDYKHAHSDFNAAIRYADQPAAPLYYNRGICNFQLNHYGAALSDFDQSLQLNSRNGMAYYLRSLTHLSLKDTTRACQDWQQAVQLGVNFPEDSLAVYCQ